MTTDESEEILACYTWEPGHSCFRCARGDVDTTHIDTLIPRSGEAHPLRACRQCTLRIEHERRRERERMGEMYEPGKLGART